MNSLIVSEIKKAYLTPLIVLVSIISIIFNIIIIKAGHLLWDIPDYLWISFAFIILSNALYIIQEKNEKLKTDKYNVCRYIIIISFSAYSIPLNSASVYFISAAGTTEDVLGYWILLNILMLCSWLAMLILLIGRKVNSNFKRKIYGSVFINSIVIISIIIMSFMAPSLAEEYQFIFFAALLLGAVLLLLYRTYINYYYYLRVVDLNKKRQMKGKGPSDKFLI